MVAGAFPAPIGIRYRRRDGLLDPDELVDALEDARRQQADLAMIVDRLERLSRSS